MSRTVLIAFGLGVLAVLAWVVLAVFAAPQMPAYLGAWLFWLGVPMGALSLVLGFELAGVTTSPLLDVLRRMLLLLPAAAVLALPVLFANGSLFDRPGLPGALPGAWVASLPWQSLLVLVVLSGIAWLFVRVPARPRRALAGLGMVLNLLLASLGAVDWVLSAQPGLSSSALGLLVMLGQAAAAASLAAFVLAVRLPPARRLPGGAGLLLALLLAGWGVVHFMQFLVVWSANLPPEVRWYLDRQPGLGTGAVWFGVVAVLAGCLVLPSALGRVPVFLATIAATALLAQLVASLWLVTPAYRGVFRLTAGDVCAVVGLGGLLAGLLLFVLPPPQEPRHDGN